MATVRRGKTYFGDCLEGEAPLRQGTAKRLCRLAAKLGRMAPWQSLGEQDLFGVQGRKGEEPDFVSVMGEAGEFRAVAVYPGVRGYAWFQEMERANESEMRRLMATERTMISVEYPEVAWELTDLDQELLAGCGVKEGTAPFRFRSVRPGCGPWYVNEEEGARLADCLEVLIELVTALRKGHDRERLWPADTDVIPLFGPSEGGWGMRLLELQLDETLPGRLWIGEEELAGLGNRPRQGAVCVGSYVPRMMAGSRGSRPMYVEAVAAVDARTGMALNITAAEPGHIAGETLSRVLVKAFRLRGAVAETVYVPTRRQLDWLGVLGSRLGFRVEVRERLPMLEELFAALEEKYGEGQDVRRVQ